MPMFLLLFLRLNIRAENNVLSTLYRYLPLFEFLRPNRHYCAITSSTYIKNTRMASGVCYYLAQTFHLYINVARFARNIDNLSNGT